MPAPAARGPSFPPVQLELRTPIAPTAFAANGHSMMIYELHLQNFSDSPLPLRAIQVLDGTRAMDAPLVSLSGERLKGKLMLVGGGELDEAPTLGPGRLAVAFLCLAFDDRSPPGKLTHRVLLDDAAADGPIVDMKPGELKILAAPLSGSDWAAVSGLSVGAHHRSGLIVAGGLGQISRRYAIDWKRRKDGAFFSGDPRDVRSYHAYGADVRAVADATVVQVRNDLPDNIPRTPAGFETAVPVTMETVAGNSVVLDLGRGQFAYYAHLKPGSVRVKTGDRVRLGEAIAAVGNSGDAREPHLHFQVTDGPGILASEGLPYVIDRFRMKLPDGSWQERANEFPLGNVIIEFAGR
ncbi:M23 family metallopeptidase [Lysobacter sp. BMK333-48F3]|uniref:M23 family metallopeptidase n=1 Tax=Lysobacter sp. BMK333-48F3 TaxID=2867962 RepID=UPI001C8CE231|nr:M23 family metallopeptidase [Lysobacter sp. BMK333-48F3]MBX9401638.1 M23 family metallopeptidase [Lysobacter sp. BMK333-48F3]